LGLIFDYRCRCSQAEVARGSAGPTSVPVTARTKPCSASRGAVFLRSPESHRSLSTSEWRRSLSCLHGRDGHTAERVRFFFFPVRDRPCILQNVLPGEQVSGSRTTSKMRRKENKVMRVVCISGSPRADGNTDHLLKALRAELDGEFIRLADHRIGHCKACWKCRELGQCAIDDDMTGRIFPLLLKSDAIVLGSPIFFNNVSADMKAFMDRTWCLRGELRNKIGGAIVVGRRYGAEGAITAINSFFLKHDMIVANRGITGLAFEKGEIAHDAEAIRSALRLAERINELLSIPRSKDKAMGPGLTRLSQST